MTAPLLEVTGLRAGYGSRAVLRGVDLAIGAGETIAVMGPNGAGKSTLLRTLMGLTRASAGTIRFDGVDMGRLAPERRARLGLGYVPEGRRIFPGMSVKDNLLVPCRADAGETRRRLDRVFDLFPQLGGRPADHAWRLSGGQQQMLAIGRALMASPRLLLLDEPALGLAPALAASVTAAIAEIAAAGPAVLVAESLAGRALAMAPCQFILRDGTVHRFDPASEHAIDDAYFGATLAPGSGGS